MNKKFKFLSLVLMALLLVVGVGAGTANAALTLDALAITSDGALALNSTDWDISATGVVTGIGAVTMDGTLTLANGETIANAVDGVLAITSPSTTFSGDITVTGDDLVMGTNTSGAVLVADGTNFNPVVMSGDATISTAGVLAIASNAVQGTDISLASEAAGDIMYSNGTDWVRLAKGTALQVLRTNAGATAPEWATMVAALDNASAWTAVQNLDAGIAVDTNNFIVDGTTGAVTAEAGITLSGATGVNEVRIPTNLADALSIEDTAGDLMVFDTTTGTQVLTITPATTITGALTFGTSLKNTAIPMATTVTRPVNFTSAPTNTSYLNKELAYFRADLDVTKDETVAGEDGFTVGMFRSYIGASQGGVIVEGLRAGVNLDDTSVIVSDGAGAGYIAGARITTYVPATSNAKTNKGLIVAPRDNSALAAIAGSQYIGQQIYLMQTVAKSESWGLDIYTESGSANLDAAINIRNGGVEKYNYGIDMNDASAPATADIRLSNGVKIFTGAAANGDAVYAEVGAKDATGSIYLTTAGKLYVQVANAGAATDWQLATTTDAD